MDSLDLERAVKSVLDEAARAGNAVDGGLLDRADLQRLVGRLKRTLERLEHANQLLETENRQLTERLCRSGRRKTIGFESHPSYSSACGRAFP